MGARKIPSLKLSDVRWSTLARFGARASGAGEVESERRDILIVQVRYPFIEPEKGLSVIRGII
jgi:hypothetical protein